MRSTFSGLSNTNPCSKYSLKIPDMIFPTLFFDVFDQRWIQQTQNDWIHKYGLKSFFWRKILKIVSITTTMYNIAFLKKILSFQPKNGFFKFRENIYIRGCFDTLIEKSVSYVQLVQNFILRHPAQMIRQKIEAKKLQSFNGSHRRVQFRF